MAGTANAGYEPESYWTEVARGISDREGTNVVAGDDEPFYRHKREKFVRTFLQDLGIAGQSCLEVGCGPGGNLEIVRAQQPKRLVGCDVSSAMVRLASRNNPSVEVVKTDGRSLPFDDDEFDTTFTVTVLQHNVDEVMRSVLAEICRVTADRIVLFEETTLRRAEKYSFVSRPFADYALVAARNGFVLESVDYLHEVVLKRLTGASRKLLNRPGLHEGSPRGKLSRSVESGLVSAFGRLDDRAKLPMGLTKLTFIAQDRLR
jgi:SAM-dependent methyltransferase